MSAPPGAGSALGDRLKWARKHMLAETSSRAAGALVGMGHAAVLRWEKSQAYPPANYLIALVQRGVSPSWLLTGDGDPHGSDSDSKGAALDLVAGIIDQWRAEPGRADE